LTASAASSSFSKPTNPKPLELLSSSLDTAALVITPNSLNNSVNS
jgi:hypothetical protein